MSNKKNLLNESQVRQFMKLAKLEPLTPGFVNGLTEKAAFKAGEELKEGSGERGSKPGDEAFVNEADEEDLEEGIEEDLDEVRTGRTGALGPKGGAANPGHGRGQGEAADGSLFEEDELEAELGATEDELGAEDLEADEEGGEIEDLEADLGDVEGAGGRVVDIDEFLSALEVALEDVLGDEVEIDSDEVEDVEDVDVEPLDAEPLDAEPLDVDVETDDVEELEEILGFGKSAADKKREKLALGPEGKYEPTTDREIARRRQIDARAKKKNEGNTDELVEQITKRVAARILKAALHKKR